jgi:hypothetical protein
MTLDEAWLAQTLRNNPALHIVTEYQAPHRHLVLSPLPTLAPPDPAPAPPSAARAPTPDGYRSKTEARYAEVLRWRQADGSIESWCYEPLSLRLGADCHYRPDFLVTRPGTHLVELVEVKGAYIRDRALDKVRMAASKFPCFVVTLAIWKGHAWTETRIAAHL